MIEIRFATDREYVHGQKQVITARCDDAGIVLFKDHQRGIYGELTEEFAPDLQLFADGLRGHVMFYYDMGRYVWDARAKDLT